MGMRETRKKRKRRKALKVICMLCVICMTVPFVVSKLENDVRDTKVISEEEAANEIEAFAAKKGYNVSDYPEYLTEMLYHTPEAEEFVLNYPKYKDEDPKINIKNCLQKQKVPLFIQWDRQWGYQKYGSNIIGVCGCGPTCLSMVTVYLKQDTSKDPFWMANYSEENGYYMEGQGTSWSLMMEGAQGLGLDVTNIPLDIDRIIANLEAGNPIICSMGPGDFTSSGHFIVLTGYKNGKITINDPNSPKRSKQEWELSEIQNQIKNLWVYR